MSQTSEREADQDPGPVKQSDAERVTGAEAGTGPGQEPDRPARSDDDPPPGRTPTDDD
jgi:hypothetical protein